MLGHRQRKDPFHFARVRWTGDVIESPSRQGSQTRAPLGEARKDDYRNGFGGLYDLSIVSILESVTTENSGQIVGLEQVSRLLKARTQQRI
jgi:hypothetical protein